MNGGQAGGVTTLSEDDFVDISTLKSTQVTKPEVIETPLQNTRWHHEIRQQEIRSREERQHREWLLKITRTFRIEMKSVTRRGNSVRSIYYVRDNHILRARDSAIKTAVKRGLRKVRVIKVSDPMSQA